MVSETAREKERSIEANLGVDPAVGLSSEEAEERRRRYGPNVLVKEQKERVWQRIVRPLREPMALLLLGAGIVYLLLGDRRDATIMFLALIPIVAVDYSLEERAQRTLSRLGGLVSPKALVLRDAQRQTIPAAELVPDDVVFVQEGDILPADGILIAGSDIRIDESSLTGEAFPVDKQPAVSQGQHRLFAGTTLVAGRGTMIVTSTGLNTQFGHVGALVASAKPRPTPTQRAIDDMVRRLSLIAAVFLIAVMGIEIGRGSGWVNALSAGVSLAIAIVPEEFAVVFTLYLTLGAWRIARRNALLRRLVGAETLGSVSVICADKTGTLTEGRMSLTGLYTNGTIQGTNQLVAAPETSHLLAVAVLASEPDPYDPLEQSLTAHAERIGLDVHALYAEWRLVEEYPFDPRGKYVSHIWRSREGALRLCAKGAIETMLALSNVSAADRERALQANQALARKGMRVLAVSEKRLARYSGERRVDEAGLRFTGLIGFTDPPRAGVRESIMECTAAGVRVIMITGDHPLTAHNVAEEIGLPHDDEYILTGETLDRLGDARAKALLPSVGIFARITPAQKHRLVRVFKEGGEVVAMTGDGINDAPALREADVGVAMGQRGTAVAREAATMVLLDDNFRTIVAAIREGRRIYENLQHVFRYLIAFHVPIVLPTFLVPLIGAPLMLLPAHLVYLELILHPTASLVFESDPPAANLMRRPPRPSQAPLLTTAAFMRSVMDGMAIAVVVLALYFIALSQGAPLGVARSLSLSAMVAGQVGLVLIARRPGHPFWEAGLRNNRFLWPILAASLASLLAILYVPQLADVMSLAPLTARELGLASALGLLCTLPLAFLPQGRQ